MRLRGTGKDPMGRYSEGLVFDVPDDTPEQAEALIEQGYATELDPKDDPGRTEVQVASAIVRGDPILDPVDREVAQGIAKPREVVHGTDIYEADGLEEAADTHDYAEDPSANRATVKRNANQLGEDDVEPPAAQARRSSGSAGSRSVGSRQRARAADRREDKAEAGGQSEGRE